MPGFELVFFSTMHIIAAATVLGAVYFAIKLYMETDKGWYWFTLLLSAFFTALSQWSMIIIPPMRGFEIIPLLRESMDIAATILFAVSCYGIYKTMKDIRRRVE